MTLRSGPKPVKHILNTPRSFRFTCWPFTSTTAAPTAAAPRCAAEKPRGLQMVWSPLLLCELGCWDAGLFSGCRVYGPKFLGLGMFRNFTRRGLGTRSRQGYPGMLTSCDRVHDACMIEFGLLFTSLVDKMMLDVTLVHSLGFIRVIQRWCVPARWCVELG